MSKFFSDLGKNITSASQKAIQKTQQVADAAGLRSKIEQEKRTQNQCMTYIGTHYYNYYSDQINDEYLQSNVKLINESKARIAEHEARLHVLQGTKACQNCGATVSAEIASCPKCGSALPVPEIPVQAPPPVIEQAPATQAPPAYTAPAPDAPPYTPAPIPEYTPPAAVEPAPQVSYESLNTYEPQTAYDPDSAAQSAPQYNVDIPVMQADAPAYTVSIPDVNEAAVSSASEPSTPENTYAFDASALDAPAPDSLSQDTNTHATSDISFCSECGSQVVKGDMFCGNCGFKVQ